MAAGAGTMAAGARAGILALRFLPCCLEALWRLRGPPKARRDPEKGSLKGALLGTVAGRGLACQGLAGQETSLTQSYRKNPPPTRVVTPLTRALRLLLGVP